VYANPHTTGAVSKKDRQYNNKKKTKKKQKTKNIVLKILNRKIKIEPHELHLKPG
jgi:hypothetical protein